MELPIPTRTKKMVIRMARQYPVKFGIIDGRDNDIIDNGPVDNDDSNYDSTDNNSYNSDPAHGTPNNDSISDDSQTGLDN